MKVELRPEPPFEDVLEIARNMRQRDQEEIYATHFGADPAELAAGVVASGAFRWAAYIDGRPVAAIGAAPRWPRVWTVWAFGTDEWNKVVLALTRHVKRFMIPAIFNSGALRADCNAMETHADARRWLEHLGAYPEKVMDNWGKNGETFVCYCWTRETTKRIVHV